MTLSNFILATTSIIACFKAATGGNGGISVKVLNLCLPIPWRGCTWRWCRTGSVCGIPNQVWAGATSFVVLIFPCVRAMLYHDELLTVSLCFEDDDLQCNCVSAIFFAITTNDRVMSCVLRQSTKTEDSTAAYSCFAHHDILRCW